MVGFRYYVWLRGNIEQSRLIAQDLFIGEGTGIAIMGVLKEVEHFMASGAISRRAGELLRVTIQEEKP